MFKLLGSHQMTKPVFLFPSVICISQMTLFLPKIKAESKGSPQSSPVSGGVALLGDRREREVRLISSCNFLLFLPYSSPGSLIPTLLAKAFKIVYKCKAEQHSSSSEFLFFQNSQSLSTIVARLHTASLGVERKTPDPSLWSRTF